MEWGGLGSFFGRGGGWFRCRRGPGSRASSGGPGSSSSRARSRLWSLPCSPVASSRKPANGVRLVGRPEGCTVIARTDSANGFGTLARVRRGRPQNEQPHYRVGLLVGIRVRGRPGYPIKGTCGLGCAELRSGALAPKSVSRVPRCTRCARRSSGVRGLFEGPVIP